MFFNLKRTSKKHYKYKKNLNKTKTFDFLIKLCYYFVKKHTKTIAALTLLPNGILSQTSMYNALLVHNYKIIYSYS